MYAQLPALPRASKTVGVMRLPSRDRCEPCKEGDEQYCSAGCTFTYNGAEPGAKDSVTKGGYSDHIVVDKECVFSLDIRFVHPFVRNLHVLCCIKLSTRQVEPHCL